VATCAAARLAGLLCADHRGTAGQDTVQDLWHSAELGRPAPSLDERLIVVRSILDLLEDEPPGREAYCVDALATIEYAATAWKGSAHRWCTGALARALDTADYLDRSYRSPDGSVRVDVATHRRGAASLREVEYRNVSEDLALLTENNDNDWSTVVSQLRERSHSAASTYAQALDELYAQHGQNSA
jgi:hypothetical protein